MVYFFPVLSLSLRLGFLICRWCPTRSFGRQYSEDDGDGDVTVWLTTKRLTDYTCICLGACVFLPRIPCPVAQYAKGFWKLLTLDYCLGLTAWADCALVINLVYWKASVREMMCVNCMSAPTLTAWEFSGLCIVPICVWISFCQELSWQRLCKSSKNCINSCGCHSFPLPPPSTFR